MNSKDIIEKKEEAKINFVSKQMEKNHYLGVFKENVLLALAKDQLEEDDIYPEIVKELQGGRVTLMKLRRDVALSKLKPYIKLAEKTAVRYQMVDGLSYKGDIALVLVTEDIQKNDSEDIVIRDMDQDFIDAGLGEGLSKKRGAILDKDCYELVKKLLPEYISEFKKVTLLDRFLGRQVHTCKKSGK